MLSLCTLALGIIAWTRIPLQFLPEASPPFINCSIAYLGATPQQVEEEVTIPAEGEFRTIRGVDYIRTISDSDGAFLHMRFDLDTDMTQATAEVRDRIERLKLELPTEIDTILLERFSSRSLPVVALALLAEKDEEQLVHRVRTVLEPRLRRIDGIADVFIRSTRPETEVIIEFSQDVLRSMNLSLYELVAVLRTSSLNVSVGELMAGGQKHFVRAVGEYRSLEDIRNLVVTPSGIQLGEVADVRYWTREPEFHAAIDSKGGAFVMAIKESEANTVETCLKVREVIDALEFDPLFEGSSTFVFFDQSELILSALRNLRDAGIYGGVMALLVLFFFLHRIRPTVIVALAIPTSLLVALVVMFLWNMSMNLISMVSMIIAIGLLVDNSIVVVENILRYRQLGLDRMESAKRGANEVSLAVTAATSTTWVVFLPLFFMEMGRMRVFMREIAIPLTVALGASLVIALTLIPLTMSRMHSRHESKTFARFGFLAPSRLPGIRHVLAMDLPGKLAQTYSYVLTMALRWRLVSFLLLAAMIVATYLVPYARVEMEEMVKLDTRRVDFELRFDQNFTIPMAEESIAIIESRIDTLREEYGIKNVFHFFDKETGRIEVYLYTVDDDPKWQHPPYSTDEVLDALEAAIPDRIPGVKVDLEVASADDGSDETGIRVRMRGDNSQLLEQFAQQFTYHMAAIEDLESIDLDTTEEKQEIQLNIDEDLSGRRGISPLVIAQTVDAALRGARMPFMKHSGREMPVWVQFREEDRKRRENLESITVFGLDQEPTELNQLVEYSKAPSPAAIHRVNGKNTVTIIARAATDRMSTIHNELLRAVEDFEMPAGYSIELGRGLEEIQENLLNFSTAIFMAIILIYLVMCALFESYLLPLSILTTVPISFVGVYWLFFLTGTGMDMVTLIGCILMVGLIVNNGIVIVDYINQLRERYVDRDQAIVRAGIDRLRPVMMTAITTILGVVPLATATTGGAVAFQGLGRAIIGGMTLGTALTLLVVPLFYATLDDTSRWLSNFVGSLLRPPKQDDPTQRGESAP
jgi:HAE1 family hydrophobic/amphiphilic exporter-1